ncbi:MAG: AmmeMemoRadiSam system protein A [Rhodospirillaceae bacterium]|jgi:AmmeMemoRadiSam system protein A|nr:AmmeMemoRadiSam system protein A [Rhodospirillaceae bacterium]MBT5374093.1 AmmeMemoRadiSam system protein A [Rhodospirillaceae bacterium]MBT5658594.1 AmmeMemoRadiSam system protein A [Rhodospirillaceae bacterium]MBT5752815.1 AmmeMemoRadiSam system protein A [Rhodospirillaceae bacterium]
MEPMSLTKANTNLIERFGATLLEIAAKSIDHGLEKDAPLKLSLESFDPEIATVGASFVTLEIAGDLRGCIGSATAWRPLVEDVAENAFATAFCDNRFTPLKVVERKQLDISLSILTPHQQMTFSSEDDLIAQLRPGEDGLVIADGPWKALFLPVVWESLSDPHDFLSHLKDKAGLKPGHWSDSFTAHRFAANAITLTAHGEIIHTKA